MPDPTPETTNPDTSNTPPKQPTRAELVAQLATVQAERDQAIAKLAEREAADKHAAETLAARNAERDQAIANKEPPRLLGTIPVYLQDSPDDVTARARALFAGQIPADRAKRFRTDAHFTAGADWPLAKRMKTRAIPLGTEFDADEVPPEERVELAAAGALIPIG